MIEKIATENELFTLGGGGDKPSDYDINRCVTKTRSTAFKSVTANLTSYQNLQLIPVSLFGKVIMADTVQIVFEHEKDSIYNDLQLDIVLVADGKEIHYNDTFHTYEWTYNSSFVTEKVEINTANNRKTKIYSIDLKNVKNLIGNNNNALIQLKAKWYNVRPENKIVKYTVKLLANGEEKYSNLNSINLLTKEYFPVDVFFRKIFEVAYNRSNDTITILDNAEPDKSATFEYDLLIKKNSNVLVSQHLKTKSYNANLSLFTKDFKKGDTITLDVRNFTINLSMSDGTKKTITPKFSKTKIGSKIKNGCKLSILKNDVNHYIAQVEILEDLTISTDINDFLFTGGDISLGDFDSVYFAIGLSMNKFNDLASYYKYNEINDNYNINLF